MARTVAIGIQDFEAVITKDCFYVDKTSFIKEWWESEDCVTLIARPRRFGKTLNMSMLDCFFSVKYAERGDLFEKLSIWSEQKYRDLQGTYPETSFDLTRRKINEVLVDLYQKHMFLRDSGLLTEKEIQYFDRVDWDMDDSTASLALNRLAD